MENASLRGAFLYGYYSLDSLYRESGAMLELSASFRYLVAGLGAGGYAGWLPGDAAWVRYRFKAGMSALVSKFTLSAIWLGFADEAPELPGRPSTGNLPRFFPPSRRRTGRP